MWTSRMRLAHTSSSLASPGTEVSYITCTLVLATLSGMHLQERVSVFTMMRFCASPLIKSIGGVARTGASCELHLIGNNLYEENVAFP